MKKVLMIALVVVVLVTGIPVLMGMPAAACADCDAALLVTATGCVAAVLMVAVSLLVAQRSSTLRAERAAAVGRLVAGRLERPPRLA